MARKKSPQSAKEPVITHCRRDPLPVLQRLSSASSLCMASFIDLFFSFSFSYFFFHCSAVSSRFTVTVFLMVLALRRRGRRWAGGVRERDRRRTNETRVRENGTVNGRLFGLVSAMKTGLHLINLHANWVSSNCAWWSMRGWKCFQASA